MRHKDEKLLAEFRAPGRCEYCKKQCAKREPHHLWTRGMGGGRRLDVRINLIALGATLPFPCCPCHGDFHDGRLQRMDFLLIVAGREQLMQHQIEEAIWRLTRAPKECKLCPQCEGAGKVWKTSLDTGKSFRSQGPLGCSACHGSGVLLANGEAYKEAAR